MLSLAALASLPVSWAAAEPMKLETSNYLAV
jgi:hypothetical protein